MKPTLLLLLGLLVTTALPAQSDTATAQVVATLQQLFDGMRRADSAAVAAAFHPQARLQSSLVDPDGTHRVQTTPISRFVTSIGSAPAGILDERLHYTAVQVDESLATAWTPYTFVLRGQISHCGTNAFQLVRTAEGWRILQVTDTRRTTGCDTTAVTPVAALDTLIDGWHRAAATADEDTFFGSMTERGIYIGTDASEHWLRDTMRAWSAPYFERDTAWAFQPYDRHIFVGHSGQYAWWDELLTTWMGPCRGSGVAERGTDGQWRIAHYHLSVTVPNAQIQEFIELTRSAQD